MSTLGLIDKAIEHCKKCRPNESGHGVTLALLNQISEEAEKQTILLEAAKEEIERLRKELYDSQKPLYTPNI